MKKQHTISIEVVEEAHKKNPKNAYKEILNRAKKLNQGRVFEDDFKHAEKFPECPQCKSESHKDGQLCMACEKKKQREQKDAEIKMNLEAKWRTLFNELQEIDFRYEIITDIKGGMITSIKRESGGHRATIYREGIYRGGMFHSHRVGSALRITTDNYDVKATGLRKDFGKAKAKDLDKRVIGLLDRLISMDKTAMAKTKKVDTVISKIHKAFPLHNSKELDIIKEYNLSSYGSRSHQARETGRFTLKAHGLKIATYDGETFALSGIGEFTSNQIAQFAIMANQFKVENGKAKTGKA